MSDNDNTENLAQDELATLKVRADMLGVTYHPNIGLEKLREKVNASVTSTGPAPDADPVAPAAAPAAAAAAEAPVADTPAQKRVQMKREATKLVRVRVTCMNPAKKEWEGEIFTTGNAVTGSIKKFVPFNADEGWHVPHMILQMMRDRMCQIFTTVTDERGNKGRKGKLIREFAIEVLDPLTKSEIAELAQRQAMSKSID